VKRPTKAEQKVIVEQWKRAAPALQQARDEELRTTPYDWITVDALLDIGAKTPFKEEDPNGLVEMQRWFMKAARKQGLLPAVVREESAAYGAAELRVRGDAAVLDNIQLALFCSVKCPGQLILDTYDLCQRFRAEGVIVISGFHSPMEQECLRILLRSPHPVVWCLARGMIRRIPVEPVDCRQAASEGRLAIVSPFPVTVRRITAQTATIRNRLVADLAAAVLVTHAAPGSKIEALCRELLAAGKPLYTFDHPANAALLQAGARAVDAAADVKRLLALKPSAKG
jgi:hypothetical protein